MSCPFEDTVNHFINSVGVQMSHSIAVQPSNLVFWGLWLFGLSIEGDQWGDQFIHKNNRLEIIISIYSGDFEPVWKFKRISNNIELVFSRISVY